MMVATVASGAFMYAVHTVAQQIAELPDSEVEAIAKRKKTITEVRRARREQKREQRRQENRKKVSAVSSIDLVKSGAKFATIVIDPPWDVADEGDVNQMGRANPGLSRGRTDCIGAEGGMLRREGADRRNL